MGGTPRVKSADIDTVFDHWVESCRNSGKGPKPVLSEKRRRLISKALKLYGLETCLQAAEGPTHSEFHMGANPHGKKYDSLELIFRNEEKIEQFATYTVEAQERGELEPF